MLDGFTVYWGVSPIQSAASQSYWERKNHVVFPKDFRPTLDWSIAFARGVRAMAAERGDNIYLMPIKANLTAYLKGVLQP